MYQPLFRVTQKISVVFMPGLQIPRAARSRCYLDYYLSLVRELYRVANQVDQDLTKPRHVADENLGYRIIHNISQVEAFLGRLRRQQVERLFNARVQLKRMMFQFQLA